jgi:HECT-domain (ubiquitin-transferase)
LYYRFVGRVLGRALFTGHLIKGHFVRLLYKHILGWPITIEDIRDQDEGYYMALHELTKMDDATLSCVCLDFTVIEGYGDVRVSHELIDNGANVDVCRDNLTSYIETNIRYRLFDRILPQVTEILLGFYDVVPEQALTVFDANELEIVLCGLPHIDFDDWKSNTQYHGLFETSGLNAVVIIWFWEIVADVYDIEMKARLLQFVTGTSGVPAGGFAFLKGGDDTPRKFTIQGVDKVSCLYPKAHTCFNVLDLPNYSTKEELQERLTFSITTSFVGFEAE